MDICTYGTYVPEELHNVDPNYGTDNIISVDTVPYVRTYVQRKEFFSTKNNGEIPAHFIILEPS